MSEYAEYDNPIVFPYVLGSIACTAGVGMAAGITLGYLSLNVMKLKVPSNQKDLFTHCPSIFVFCFYVCVCVCAHVCACV